MHPEPAPLPLARRTERLLPSAIREILKLTRRPDVISFAGGLPSPTMFPVEATRAAFDRVLAEAGAEALQYGPTEGHGPLREEVAARIGVDPEEVRIVSGSQQALDLVGKVLIDPGARVAVGAPTYMGALRAFDPYGPAYAAVESDADGLLPESVDAAFRSGARILYAIPDFDNPTGATLAPERRVRIAELAREHGAWIVEDDPYGALRFEGEPAPSLRSLAPERTIHMGTWSKIMTPGLRLAWVAAPEPARTFLTRAKQATDLHTSTLVQMVAADLMAAGEVEARLPALRAYYRDRRDLMAAELERSLPRGVRSTRPRGGMFAWLELPAPLDATALAPAAAERGVAYVPGEPFYPNGGGRNTMRLSWSVATDAQIRTGIAVLGEVLADALADARTTDPAVGAG